METRYQKEQLFALLEKGVIRIVTDLGEIEVVPPTMAKEAQQRPGKRNEWRYETPFAEVSVRVFEKGKDTVYRSVTLRCKTDLILYRVDFELDFGRKPCEFIDYKTFVNAPAAAFVRYDSFGFYTGVENPFFKASSEGARVRLSYEPSLMLKAGEIYETEPQFLGSYERSGVYIKEKEPINQEALERGVRRSRFFNPCGEIGLDIAERDAMRSYVAEYYDVIKKQFDNILYFFFYPKKQLPQTESEIQDYLGTIDRFSEMSGDIVAFNPHVNTVIPDEEKPYWELAPENSAAERILRYAQKKGLRCGYYMGCAFNGSGGNAALLSYMPEKKSWKKVDSFGNTAKENCLGCDEYLDWWYEVQKNTIQKYDLGYWSWDPGPGNGNDCYAADHGHIPGKGEYKGWRNSQKLLARLKEEFPELFLMSFYGRKEYGIWGFRYFSQHEVYWEQTVLFGATLHNDLHDDRINAHGTRLQNQWCMNFRFLPADLGHGLVPRMGESWFDPAMERAYDFGGWKYALLSAIACCGSVTHCTLPDRLENVPGYREFYQKWIRWAKENYRYCAFTKPLTDSVSNEVIDGFSRIDKDSGQIFLFNSSPKVMHKRLTLDAGMGLDTDEAFELKLLYCEGMELDDRTVFYGDAHRMGEVLDITLPAYGAVVLEVEKAVNMMPAERVMEIPHFTHTIDRFREADGTPFFYPEHPACESVSLTASALFRTELKEALNRGHIENEAFLMEKIPEWHEKGMPFTFASALPSRLVMYIPFDGPKLPEMVRLFLNEEEVPVEIHRLGETAVFHYAFVENYVRWEEENVIQLEISGLAENSFLGIHVDYPEGCDGMRAEEVVFEERNMPSRLYPDQTLVIDSFTLSPEALSDLDEEFSVQVKTAVEPERIESVYFLHPSAPQMAALEYDPDEGIWHGTFRTGNRAGNIFCNTVVTAWIKAKDGGVGPRKECRVKVRYTC